MKQRKCPAMFSLTHDGPVSVDMPGRIKNLGISPKLPIDQIAKKMDVLQLEESTVYWEN